jgi:hypothetical protein
MGRFQHVESSEKEDLSINTDAIHDFDDYVCNKISDIIKNKSFTMAIDVATLQRLSMNVQQYHSIIGKLINVCKELSDYVGE